MGSATSQTVVCRPTKATVVTASVLAFAMTGLAVAIPFMPPATAERSWIFAFFALFALLTIGHLVWSLRATVAADAAGLRWRGLLGWRSARWNEVTDYYVRLSPKLRQSDVIETTLGRVSLDRDWAGREDLREVVAARATGAGVSGWGQKDARLDAGEVLVFAYSSSPVLAGSALFVFAMAGTAAIVGPKAGPVVRDIGWPMAMGAYATMLLTLGSVSALPLVVAISSGGGRRRTGQTITVDRERVRFSDGHRAVDVPWDDVLDYCCVPVRRGLVTGTLFTVETKHGTFDFDPAIGNGLRLRMIISAMARNAASKEWIERDRSGLYDLGAPELGIGAAPDAIVFHYHTSDMRALLLLPLALAVAFPIAGAMPAEFGDNPGTEMHVAGGVFLALWLWGLWRSRTAMVVVDHEGITEHKPFRRVRLNWSQVRSYRIVGDDILRFGIVQAEEGRRIRFWTGIGRSAELRTEIARRATAAVERGWE